MKLLALVIALLFPAIAAANPLPTLSEAQVGELRSTRQFAVAADEMFSQKLIPLEQARAMKAVSLQAAAAILRRSVTAEDVDAALEQHKGMLARAAGFLTFTHVLLFCAGLLLVIAVGWLCRLYMTAILAAIPHIIYEIALYGFCLGAIIGGPYLGARFGVKPDYLLLPGCLGLIGALSFTQAEHFGGKYHGSRPFSKAAKSHSTWWNLCPWICTIVWSLTALVYGSQVIGFLAVMGLMYLLGFSVWVGPLFYCIGFDDEKKIPRTMAAAFLLLAVYVSAQLTGIPPGRLAVFSAGFLWLGAFIYFCSLLITSSIYVFREQDSRSYLLRQVLAAASCLLALFIGSVYDITPLSGIGGTFFFLWFLEKYFEIPWGKKGRAWAALGLAVILYFSAGFAQQHPQFFQFWR